MGFHDHLLAFRFTDAISEKADEFLERLELLGGGFVVVVVADETNADADVVQVVAVDVSTCLLDFPTVADLDLSVARGGSVSDHEMIGEAVLHFADAAVVIFECLGVPLARAAVVNDDVLPASFGDCWAVDLVAEGWGDVFPLRF